MTSRMTRTAFTIAISRYRQSRNGASFARSCLVGPKVEFPFRVRSGRELKMFQPPIITVIGKTFFDVGHAPADHANRRTDQRRLRCMGDSFGHETRISLHRCEEIQLKAKEAQHGGKHSSNKLCVSQIKAAYAGREAKRNGFPGGLCLAEKRDSPRPQPRKTLEEPNRVKRALPTCRVFRQTSLYGGRNRRQIAV